MSTIVLLTKVYKMRLFMVTSKNSRKKSIYKIWVRTVLIFIWMAWVPQIIFSIPLAMIDKADTVYINLGDSINITGLVKNLSQWSSSADFRQLNAHSIRVSPPNTSTYYFKNFIRKTVVNENASFEFPKIAGGFKIISQDRVPGWKTTAKDGKIELWTDKFLGVKSYDGNQFAELNANMVGHLYQDVITDGGEDLLIEFSHHGRSGPEKMSLKFGPPAGPYETVGIYTSSPNKWTTHEKIITIPAEQKKTRIFFASEHHTSPGAGNLLDAIKYTSVKTISDSIVVVVGYPMTVNKPLAASIFDDGNGIADSLIIEFEQQITAQNRFDSITFYWGQDINTYSWDEFKPLNKQKIMLSQKEFSQHIHTGSVTSEDKAYLKLYYSDLVHQSGNQKEQVIPVEDKIGPVLLEAFIKPGERQVILATYSEKVVYNSNTATDSLLLYQIKNPMDSEFRYLYQDFNYIGDSLHSMVDHADNKLTSKDSIKLAINLGVYDNQGNFPHINNTYIILSYDHVNAPFKASVYDNGNGIADSLVIDFELDFSNSNRFDSLCFYWGQDTNTYLWGDFQISKSNATLSQKAFSQEIYTGQLSNESHSSIKVFYSDTSGLTKNPVVRDIEVKDKVGPVIVKASLWQGDRQLIRVKYSEMIQPAFITDQDSIMIYEIKNTTDHEVKYYFQDFDYTSDSLNSKIYQAEQRLQTKDSIRLTLINGVYDMQGNYPHQNNHYVEVDYYRVLEVEKSKIAQVPEFIFTNTSMDMQLVDRNLELAKIHSIIQRVGIRYNLDFKSFLEDHTAIDPSAIEIYWQMELFTNYGGFIDQESGSVKCDNFLFEGSCLEDDRMMYVGWNMKDKSGRKAATGAYIARVVLKLTYHDTLITKSNELWNFGLRRTD